MSTLRKTVLATAIIGAGLASTTGSAFATECHHGGHHESHNKSSSSSSSCTNNIKALNSAEGAGKFVNVAGGDQIVGGLNVCDNLNNNKILNGNSISVLGGLPL